MKPPLAKCWLIITFPDGTIKDQVEVSWDEIREIYVKKRF